VYRVIAVLVVLLLSALANLAVAQGLMTDTLSIVTRVNYLEHCTSDGVHPDYDQPDPYSGYLFSGNDDDDDDIEDDDDADDDDDWNEDDEAFAFFSITSGNQTPQTEPDPEHDLKAKKVNKYTGRIRNKSDYCKYQVGIASYKRFDNVVANEELFDWKTQWILPNQETYISVTLPNCAAHVYMFYGDLIVDMPSQGYGDRLLRKWKVNGNNYCPQDPPWEDSPNDFSIHINFQPKNAPQYQSYEVDSGNKFGYRDNGLHYGWNQNNHHAKDRNSSLSQDQRYDTLIETQLGNQNRYWEIELPNGVYDVHVVMGDATKFNSVYRLDVEGQTVIDGTPNSGMRWFEGVVIVEVEDGRLTLTNTPGSDDNKINYIDIEYVGPPTP